MVRIEKTPEISNDETSELFGKPRYRRVWRLAVLYDRTTRIRYVFFPTCKKHVYSE